MARHKEAFVVNRWFESRGPGKLGTVEWRGSVEHVMTQNRRYFTDIVDLVSFLTAYAPNNQTEERGRE
jgi:hypothetical protein